MSETIASWLRRLARPPILPGESHRRSLENELADLHGSARKENTVYTVLFRAGVAAGLLAAVGAGASQLPATYQAEVGKRIEIRTPQPPAPGAVQAAVKSIEAGAEAGRREVQVRVRVTAEPAGGALVRIDAFGDTIGLEGIPAAIRSCSPAFATAEITVQPVDGSVEGDLGSMVGTKVLGERLSGEQVDAAVRKLEADAARLEADAVRMDADGKRLDAERARLEAGVKRDLAASGVTGDVRVDVKTDEADGQIRREVRVIVTKENEAGAR
jgi:hypothetical protein